MVERGKQVELETKSILKKMQLDHRKNSLISDISGGQRKRVSIAMELMAKDGSKVLAMSDKSYKAFGDIIKTLEEKHGQKIVHPDIDNIERIFGGGVRCMIAEIFE